MIFLLETLCVALCVNTGHRFAALRDNKPEPDPVPLLKLFNPVPCSILEIGDDADDIEASLIDNSARIVSGSDMFPETEQAA